MTGERLQNQRPHPLARIEDEEDAHEIDTGNGCSGGCDLLAGELSILNTIQKNILVHKFRVRLKRLVLSCAIPAETRASSRTTTKRHR